MQFSINKSLYLANDTKYRHSYYPVWNANRNSYAIYLLHEEAVLVNTGVRLVSDAGTRVSDQ